MVEVSTRPQNGQTKAAKAAKAVKPAQQMAAPELLNKGTPQPEWVSLALPHIRKLSDLLFNLVDQDEHAPELIQALVAEASDKTTSLWSKEYAAGDSGSMWSSLNTVVLMLRAAMCIAEHEPQGTIPALHASVIPESIDFARSIMDAVYSVPSLQRLHALNDRVSMGMRPFRDRPQPPIRRVERDDIEAHGLNPVQLISVLEHVATTSNLLEDILNQTTQIPDIPMSAQCLIDAAKFINRGTGAMADKASGASIVGDLNAWHMGVDFCSLGKGGAA